MKTLSTYITERYLSKSNKSTLLTKKILEFFYLNDDINKSSISKIINKWIDGQKEKPNMVRITGTENDFKKYVPNEKTIFPVTPKGITITSDVSFSYVIVDDNFNSAMDSLKKEDDYLYNSKNTKIIAIKDLNILIYKIDDMCFIIIVGKT